MMTAIRGTVLWVAAMLLAGCGPGAAPSAQAPGAAKADMTVIFDGERHTCLVSLASEMQGSQVPCEGVVPFVRDELRLPSGASFDARTVATFDAATIARVESELKGAGYRYIGAP